jgi:CRISPR-associated protein Csc1
MAQESFRLGVPDPAAGTPPAVRSISLGEHGVRLFACILLNHDYLWFSGTEFSKRSETLPVLHNYALTYSLGDYSHWQGPATPRYEEDLANIPLYATPASSAEATRTRLTYNAVDSRSLRTDAGPRGVNTPDLGYRTYINPVFGPGEDARQRGGFLTYLFTFNGSVPKGVTRLGKKGTAWRVRSTEVTQPRAVWRAGSTDPSHTLNPLDVSGEVVAYEPIALPPHLLCRRASVRGDWFVFGDTGDGQRHTIHVPRRVLLRLGRAA